MNQHYKKCPLNKYTFKIKTIREFVISNSTGFVLNLFCGKTLLPVKEIRNDIDTMMPAKYHMEAVDFVSKWNGNKFNTIILDPPYSYRKSMEMYNGHRNSKFKMVKDLLPEILLPGGNVITMGYHSVNMGINRGFELVELCVFSHGGAIHDTLCSVEKYIKE